MNLSRRKFLGALSAVPIAAALDHDPLARTIFLPPRGGWFSKLPLRIEEIDGELTAVGGTGPYTWSVLDGDMQVVPFGYLVGRPSITALWTRFYPVTVDVTDSLGERYREPKHAIHWAKQKSG